MKENNGYIYCIMNDCNDNDKTQYSRCCFFCDLINCPERCRKKEYTFCHSLSQGLSQKKKEE